MSVYNFILPFLVSCFDNQDYNAKLSDFGLAKDGPVGDKSHVSTRIMGTYGYAAPEYIMTGIESNLLLYGIYHDVCQSFMYATMILKMYLSHSVDHPESDLYYQLHIYIYISFKTAILL